MARDLNVNEGTGGVQIVTVAGGPTSTAATDQECTEVTILHKSGVATFLNIGAVATTASFPISAAAYLTVKVTNLDQINVIGTATDEVALLWRK